MHSYRIISAWCTARREQEISQTVRYKFVSLDTVWLQHMGMWSDDNLHTKGHKMFSYMNLVRLWF